MLYYEGKDFLEIGNDMKFRHKVLLVNIIIIAITLSISGYLIMSRQNRLMMDAQIKNAVTENNLIESVVEYSLLDIINNPKKSVKGSLPDISDQVTAGMLSTDTELFVGYEGELLYASNKKDTIPKKLLRKPAESGRKRYEVALEKQGSFVYVITAIFVEEKEIAIITKRNITDTKFIINNNIKMFRYFIVVILALSGFLVYVLSLLLTRPLEKLNRVTDDFAEGNFATRSKVRSRDEVGLLSEKFNHMADSVEGHIDELNDMIHRRDQFVADFTHEIKTPMTTIIGYADTIRSVELPRETEVKAANYIFSEGKRLEQMSQHLFDLIYLKDGKIPKQPVNTQALGDAVVETILPSIEKAGISLEADFENDSLVGDASLLKTVFINLLDNARKATVVSLDTDRASKEDADSNKDDTSKENDKNSEKKIIRFTGKKLPKESKNDGERYQFIVEDQGIGIAKEDIDRICDEFYMVDKSRSRKEGGAGLGMSLVAAILKEHEAELTIESELGVGTKMIVTF